MSPDRADARPGTSYINVFRNTPLLLILFLFSRCVPHLGFTYGVNNYFNFFFVAATIGLGLYAAAFVCEALRSGINSIPLGQAEAARAHRDDVQPVDDARSSCRRPSAP